MTQSKVTAGYVARCQPYRVRMGCGHVESRMMREATAGVPWSPDAEIDASPGSECKLCRAQKLAKYLFDSRQDAGTHGPWFDQVGKAIVGTDAAPVVNEVLAAMSGSATWANAFLAVMNGEARAILEKAGT